MAQHSSFIALAKCTCCGQQRPVPLFSRAALGARWLCGWCDLLTGAWLNREMKRLGGWKV